MSDNHEGQVLATVVGPDPVTGAPMVYTVRDCIRCQVVHVMPLPSREALQDYYEREFYQHEKPDYIARYEEDRAWWETCVHGPLLRQAGDACGQVTPHLSILDVGAGPGIALDVAAGDGWQTAAIEPSPVCAQRLRERGHWVYQGSVEGYHEAVKDMGRQYHMVYLYEVLEHQPHPEAFLRCCLDLLKPGGILVVCVPNDGSPLQEEVCKHLQCEPYWYAPPQHLTYFTGATLQRLLQRCGLSIVDIRGSYPLETHILAGRNYLGNDTLGREVHRLRMQDELDVCAMGAWQNREESYRDNMQMRGWGREILCLARKPAS